MEFALQNIIFYIVFIAAFSFFTYNVMRLISYLKLAEPTNRLDKLGKRITQTLLVAFAQSKILRDKKAGPIHAFIFWGFLILLFSAANAIFAGFGLHHAFNFLGPVYSLITILTDIFIFLIIIAVVGALWRRYISKVKRLQVEAEKLEAAFILIMIFFIVTALLLENASMIALGTDASWAVRPLAAVVAALIPVSSAPVTLLIGYWVHLAFILIFMNYLPFSKHLHVLTSVPNVFLSPTGPVNTLQTIDFEDESIESYGVSDVEQFNWKNLLDGYTCTHCGRCTSVCPANITGKVLDPREIIVQMRERTFDRMPILKKQRKFEAAELEKAKQEAAENGSEFDPATWEAPEMPLNEEEQALMDKPFLGDYQSIEALWQCTTCGACMQECPVNIEHVPAIVDMRRSLVMMEADFPELLQGAFENMETNSSPWAFPASERAAWAEGTGIKSAAEKQEFDVLFWVGCAGSFDDRAKKTTLAFTELMQEAGVDFAILGNEEQCNGDPARRAGNEYLADTLVKANIETINQYKFNKIVATCPHCFNTLKNEFPMLGGNYTVIHHTQYLMNLIKEGKLGIDAAVEIDKLAYHDSCYLGRYNDEYDAPRDGLKKISDLDVIDPERSRDRGLCCGAGGAQMFMEETEGKRVNIERTEELIATGADTIAVNCPFCMTMISDGVKTLECEENVKVKDIAEIMLESVKNKQK